MLRNKGRWSLWLGKQAEDNACRYLTAQGLTLVEANYRCRYGEIDLIMRDREFWVFVEVKYRTNSQYGRAEDYFDVRKRKKFVATLQHFMQSRRLNLALVAHRIDLIAIDNTDIQWQKGV